MTKPSDPTRCAAHPDGRHQIIQCDDPLCCWKGYIEVCVCGAKLGNQGRKERKALRRLADTKEAL